MDQRQGSRRRNSRNNLATTWEGDRARKGSAPSLSGLHLGTTLANKFSSSTTARLTESAGNNRDDRSLELKHAGDSTAADLKTLDFPARSEFLLATGGENSIRRGLKILGSESSVRVRVPPPALIHRTWPRWSTPHLVACALAQSAAAVSAVKRRIESRVAFD